MNDEKQPPLYQILHWNDHFENSKSRRIEKCGFLCIPNRHGVGFRSVFGELDGPAIYGIWCAILELCSRQVSPRDGWITRDGMKNGPRYSAEDLARYLGRNVAEVYRVFQVTSRKDIGWMRLIDGNHEWQKKAEKAQNDPGATPERPCTDGDQTTIELERNYANDQGFTNVGGETPERPCTDPVGHKKERKNEDVLSSITLHNITVRRGELDNKLKTEEELPWIDALFQTHEPWSFEELQLLSQLLPIRPESKRLLIWAHNIPPENPFHQMTKLKQARLFLLREFGAEVDKIRSVRRQMGLSPEIAERKTA